MATSDRVPASRGDTDARTRKPSWLKVVLPHGEGYERVKGILAATQLHTVCQEARCPNQGECWGGGTATVMLMGGVCTRACRFCYVKVGHPAPLDPEEPAHLARAARELALRYLVVTSVDRDDLPDGGAGHFARAIGALRRECPDTILEVLVPDFQGKGEDLDTVARARPHVIGHNVETVERLQAAVRDRRAGYRQSLFALERLKSHGAHTKSSLMLGLGETRPELEACFADLRRVGVDVLTLGQYLQPSPRHLKVERYVPPEEFEELKEAALGMGFLYVAAGPLVRSSYRAAELFVRGLGARGQPAVAS